jgi:pimeloyl-ACP methyl ester carboxylesterase
MPTSITPQREVLFLLHGIGAHPWMMRRLAGRLQQAGYDVNNWGYPSVLGSIEVHSEKLVADLQMAESDPSIKTIHIVAHSMGSIVTRHALIQFLPTKLRRVVLLGPPNQGSPWATVFGPLLRLVCRPIDQLAGRSGSFVKSLAPLKAVEFGVVAAGHDMLVPLNSTHLEGERDHCVVPCFHSMLLFRDDVADKVRCFLADGTFQAPRRAA